MTIRNAMLLAAGLGTRMRPLTDTTAKPLVPLAGRTLLDHALDRLFEAGVEHVVVNTHWKGDLVAAHIAARHDPRIVVRAEETLLDTGGAIVAALKDGLLDQAEPFYVVNGDAFWLNGPTPMLDRLAEAWTQWGGADAMDALLLVHRTFQISAEVGAGDFVLDPLGHVRRRKEMEIVPYLFAGVQIASAHLFTDAPQGPFSTNLLWDRAIEAERLRALVHDGLWFHLSTPEDLEVAEQKLYAAETGETR
ncbi:Mannose-1-phosphate guanyltransferase [Granulibacter bethesdensis]|uniref:Mannose-1-phosphate guanyltransferase n=1 Tax=Granulibacter bethesdensis TaxID=364410 RepID=A0AAC9P9Q9_9PROT|nr:nucleotidyltransferase family protein [Granulibacter bethesdensis]APH55324.1 Mannose-1-phosphate guanyltransferase [Granulibacter bethesdensis]APH62911.1 Mannose-1-phosphate guanyltransferase [Granulibacter bethesdensis]